MRQGLESGVQSSICTEEARQESEADELTLILEQVDASIALFNFKHRLVRFNQSFANQWKLPLAWLQTRPRWDEILAYLTIQEQLTELQAKDIRCYLEHAKHQTCSFEVLQADNCRLEMQVTATAERTILLVIKPKRELYESQLSSISSAIPAIDITVTHRVLQQTTHQQADLLQQNGQQFYVISETTALGIGVAGLDQRISDYNQLMEEAVCLNQFHCRQIVETAREGILVIDVNNQITFVNQMMADMFGCSVSEMLGKSIFEFMDEVGQKLALRNVERRRQGIQEQLDFKFQRRDGSDLWAIVSTKPLFDQSGRYIGVLGMLTDITERKHWEEFLQQANAQLGIQVTTPNTKLHETLNHLQQEIKRRKQVEDELRVALDKEKALNQLKSRFVSMVSHEFGNPLTAILAASQLLEQTNPSESKKAEYFRLIQASVEQMKQLIEDVLLIGKAEAERVQIKPTMIDLNLFCCRLLGELRLGLGRNYHLQLVDLCADPNVCLDPKLLRHILCNLLTNAIKYSPHGGSIQLEVMRQNSEVVFQVQDEGIGIPEKDLPQLFGNFSRAGNVGKIQGTGLGLSIVKHCVDVLGGQISVASKEDEGTTFRVVLPLVMPSTNARQVQQSQCWA